MRKPSQMFLYYTTPPVHSPPLPSSSSLHLPSCSTTNPLISRVVRAAHVKKRALSNRNRFSALGLTLRLSLYIYVRVCVCECVCIIMHKYSYSWRIFACSIVSSCFLKWVERSMAFFFSLLCFSDFFLSHGSCQPLDRGAGKKRKGWAESGFEEGAALFVISTKATLWIVLEAQLECELFSLLF